MKLDWDGWTAGGGHRKSLEGTKPILAWQYYIISQALRPFLFNAELDHQILCPYDKIALNHGARIQQAILDYGNRRYSSIRSTAAANDVDRETLTRRRRGGVSRSIAHESQQLLSNQQEQLLVPWILNLETQGHPPSFTQVQDLVIIIRGGSVPSVADV